MTAQNNYVAICNWAQAALDEADGFLENLTDHEIRELQGLIDEEARADRGRSLTIQMIKAVVDAEAAYRPAGK